jgi:hypothetical protein
MPPLKLDPSKPRRLPVGAGATKLGTKKSDAKKVDAKKPDAANPDATNPDATKADATKPDATNVAANQTGDVANNNGVANSDGVAATTTTAATATATAANDAPSATFDPQSAATNVADATNATSKPGTGLSTLDLRLGKDGLTANGTGNVRVPGVPASKGNVAIGAGGVVDATGIKTAKATAALKALLGNTSIDTTGTGVVITNNRLTQAQFQAALQTVFGDGAKLSADGTFTWNKGSGVDAKLITAYQGIVAGVQVSSDANLTLTKGAVAGDVNVNLKTLVGSGVLVADNQVVFADNKWQSATFNDEVTQQFGASASLDAVIKSTVDNNGVKSAVATAAVKALIGNTTLDTTGSSVTITNNGLSAAQFQAAIATVFGDGAKVNANGTFTWTKDDAGKTGIDASLITSYQGVVRGLTVAADSSLTLTKGAIAGDVEANLQKIVGDSAFVSNAKVVFADSKWQSLELQNEVKSKFGDAGSIDATFNATVDDTGIKTATATAAVKALIGSTSIDTSGTTVTITNNKLTQAQFAAAIQTVFGDGAKVNANGTFTWNKDDAGKSGVSASLMASYQGVVAGVDVAADGNLTLKDGAVSGDVSAHLQKVVGQGLTITSDNKIVLENSRIANAQLDESVQSSFGANGSLAATLQATIDHDGIQTMTATAALKALLGGNTTIDTTGTGLTITNNKLTKGQFQSAIKTVFPNAVLAANGSFQWDKTSGVAASVVADFKGTVHGIDVGAGGNLTLKDGAIAGDVEAHAKGLLGSTVVMSDDKLVFADSRLQSAELNHEAVMSFGASASLDATFKSTIDREGIASATATAAFKAVAGNTTFDTTGTGFTITRGQLTQAQFQAAVTTLFGPNAKVSADGRFTWNKDSGIDAQLAGSYAGLVRGFDVKSDGTITLKDGKVDGDVSADMKRVLGSNTIVANGKLVFADNKFQSAEFGAGLTKQFGDTASLDATFAASIDAEGKTEASIKIAAFKRLKELGDGGAIDFKPDGSVVIKDGKIDRAEVGALVSVVAGKDVNLDTSGKLVYADGKIDTEFGANLASTWNGTKVDANGTLSITDGKPELQANANAVFGDNTVGVGGKIGVDGVSQASLNFKLAKLFGSNIDANGSLQLDHGQLQAGLTTNLVVGGDDPTKISLGGVVAFTDKKKAAQLQAQVNAGVVSGGFNIGTQATSEVYQPDARDPVRAAIAQNGAAWSIKDVTYTASANAGANFTIMAGGVPLQLGFNTSGSATRETKVLSLHPNPADAAAEHAVFSLRSPQSVDDVLAMKPYEQVTDTGNQSMGFGGHVAVGMGAGPATASIGGEVYCQMTGNMSRDIERLDGNKVRVRFRRGSGEMNVKALSMSVGVKTPTITGNDVVDKAAAPIIEQLAQLGLKQSWENMTQKDSAFDVTIDASTPAGREALDHLLKNDLSEAQYWARTPDSGVTLNANAVSYVNAKTDKLDVNLATLNKEDMARWLSRQQKTLTKDSFTITDALDFTAEDKAFFPWNANKNADVRLVHETELPAIDAPDLGLESVARADNAMHVRMPVPRQQGRTATLDDTRALLGVRMKVADPKTSLKDIKNELNPGVDIMQMMGFSEDEMRPLARLRDAIDQGAVPDKKSIFWGMGDQRFGATSIEVEGFVSPTGLKSLLGQQPPKTRADFATAYVDAQAAVKAPSYFSKAGIVNAIADTMIADIEPNPTGGYTIKRDGALIGRLSDNDIARVQAALLAAPTARDVKLPANIGTFLGPRPKEMLDPEVDADAFNADRGVRDRAFAFGDSMTKASALFVANQLAPQKPGESDADFAKRADDFKKTSLYGKPDEFYGQIDDWVKSALQADSDKLAGPLALLTLAGEPSLYGRVELELPKEAGASLIDAGKREVQKFGAFQLLVGMGAKIDPTNRSITIAAGAKPELANAAVKALFGDRAQIGGAKLGATRNGRIDVVAPQLEYERMQKLSTLFDDVKLEDGKLKLPEGFDGEVARGGLDAVTSAAVDDGTGRIVFDNAAFDFVHLGDALESMFGKDSFGAHEAGSAPPQFPVTVPVEDEGAAQDPNAIGTNLALRHVGPQASWGSKFSKLAYLRGKDKDLAKTKPEDDWLLKERSYVS